jgi:porin
MKLSFLGAIFNGDPAGPARPFDDPEPQRRNRTGTNFRVQDPAFLIGEAAYTYHQGKEAAGLPGTIKLGAWAHLGRRFNDQRFDNTGLSLADPNASGVARLLRGNTGAYAVVDQMIYRLPGTTDQGIGVFARVSGSPSDRNLISFYADGGLTFKGLIPSRTDDTFGVSMGYAGISDRARKRDRDARLFAAAGAVDPETGEFNNTGGALPVRSSEALIEVTYQAQIIPGWTVQPDVQYVFRPGGNIPNPRDPNGTAIKNAAIFGLRTTIRY